MWVGAANTSPNSTRPSQARGSAEQRLVRWGGLGWCARLCEEFRGRWGTDGDDVVGQGVGWGMDFHVAGEGAGGLHALSLQSEVVARYKGVVTDVCGVQRPAPSSSMSRRSEAAALPICCLL